LPSAPHASPCGALLRTPQTALLRPPNALLRILPIALLRTRPQTAPALPQNRSSLTVRR
jgi:hypothetical protein